MRIDVVTIFPEYLAPLELSLIGKAREDGLLDVRAHNLRDVTTDRHHTVDDTPYGGGAGMVMKPDVWGAALDLLLAEAETAGTRPRLIVPGPGGVPFTQALAHELAREKHLVFACGRYEGIDERVYEYARERFVGGVDVVSLGDYVLNGGEVAVLAMAEAIVRLVPGVVGNAESLVEESHEDGLLEYPVYTKPASWQGREVPKVLLSGDHAAIEAWRHQQRLARTAARRPDLLPPTSVTGDDAVTVTVAVPGDAGELYTLFAATLPGVTAEPFEAFATRLRKARGDEQGLKTLVARVAGRLVGAVQHRLTDGGFGPMRDIQAVAVAPDLRRQGIGRALLRAATTGDSSRTPVRLDDAGTAETARAELDGFMRRSGYRPAGAPGLWRSRKRR